MRFFRQLGWSTCAIDVPEVAAEASLGYQTSKDLASKLEVTQADRDVTFVTEHKAS